MSTPSVTVPALGGMQQEHIEWNNEGIVGLAVSYLDVQMMRAAVECAR
jgi:hypothetical protein